MTRKGALTGRRAILLASTVLMAAAAPWSGALAADQDLPVKAVPEVPGWYFNGGLEFGGRWVDRPPSGFGYTATSGGGGCSIFQTPPNTRCFLTPSQTQSRAKFEEYGAVPSGAFLDWINLQTGTRDGRYALDFWGTSVGENNQYYRLDAAKIGEHYVTLVWDQIPHLISTSAKTVFGGVGSPFLVVDPTLRANLNGQLANATATGAAGDTARTNIQNFINNAAGPLDLATRRDRGTAAYRWTPTPEVDVEVDYTNEHRTGTRPLGISYGWGTSASPRPTNVVEVPQPLDDTTQTVNAKVEKAGIDFLGMRITSNVLYSGSFYDNSIKEIDVQNPFCFTCNVLSGGAGGFGPQMLRMGLPPSNEANAITNNTAIDFPFLRARYVSTLQYNEMRQNDMFVNPGTNGMVAPPVTTLLGTPVSSLNGQVDTLLWNNLFTAQVDKDVKLTLRGRHYSIDNTTPMLHIENWIWGDSGCAAGTLNPVTGQCSVGNARNSLPIAYTKDNVSGEATWRATHSLSVGGGVYWERYERQFRDVDVTNEATGKAWLDFTPLEQFRFRTSYQYGERRYETYDPALFVETPGLQFSDVASNMRRFDVANRNRQKADAAIEWSPGSIFTVTPNAGIRYDDYPDPVLNPLGVSKDHSWNAGFEVGAVFNPTFKVMAAYNYEERKLNMAGGSGGANVNTGNLLTDCSTSAAINPDAFLGTSCTWLSDINQKNHTYMLAADWKVIPSTFDLRFEYLYVISSESNNTTPCRAPGTAANSCNGLQTTTPATDPASLNFGQFPPERNEFQRFNVIGRYYVDPSLVRQMGWTGDVTFKVRYTWERNVNTNWATDSMTPYVGTPDSIELTGGGRSVFLAAFNPNYSAQVLAASVQLKW